MNEWFSARIAASIVGLVRVWLAVLVVLHPELESLPLNPCMTRTNSLATRPSVALPVGLPDPSAEVVTSLPLMITLLAAPIVTGVV